MDVSLVRLGVVITFEVEDPKGVQMGMNGHVKGVRLFADLICLTVVIETLTIAWVAG